MKHNSRPGKFYPATTIRSIDVTGINPYHWHVSTLALLDYTAEGRNLVDVHPLYTQYYADLPAGVTLKDDDDAFLVRRFPTLAEAQHFFEEFLNNPVDAIETMED